MEGTYQLSNDVLCQSCRTRYSRNGPSRKWKSSYTFFYKNIPYKNIRLLKTKKLRTC